MLIENLASFFPAADDVQGFGHHPFDFRRNGGRVALEQFHGQLAIPHGAVNRAVDGLVLRCEQPFDLLIG